MSIMSGLVETGTPQTDAPRPSLVADWTLRHAWALVVAGGIAFWATVAAVLIWG